MAEIALAAAGGTAAKAPTAKDRRWALILLLAISTVAFIDRSILNTVGQAINDDLRITDLQLGLLGGAAFAILYGVLAIPVARLAERRSRTAIISIALAVWSAMTALCGLAGGFTYLLLARIGVGVGEAGAGASSQSLLSDDYPPEKRASVSSSAAWGERWSRRRTAGVRRSWWWACPASCWPGSPG